MARPRQPQGTLRRPHQRLLPIAFPPQPMVLTLQCGNLPRRIDAAVRAGPARRPPAARPRPAAPTDNTAAGRFPATERPPPVAITPASTSRIAAAWLAGPGSRRKRRQRRGLPPRARSSVGLRGTPSWRTSCRSSPCGSWRSIAVSATASADWAGSSTPANGGAGLAPRDARRRLRPNPPDSPALHAGQSGSGRGSGGCSRVRAAGGVCRRSHQLHLLTRLARAGQEHPLSFRMHAESLPRHLAGHVERRPRRPLPRQLQGVDRHPLLQRLQAPSAPHGRTDPPGSSRPTPDADVGSCSGR